MILFAGAMFTSAAFAWPNDPFAEERYRMKYGRYSQAEEARQKAAKEAQAKSTMNYVEQACCRLMQTSFANTTPLAASGPSMEERFRMKYGRGTPSEEARQRATEVETAMHIAKCAELGRCPRMHVASANMPAVAVNPSDIEARFRMKYGRSAPVEQRATGKEVQTERLLVASVVQVPCEQECCKPGQ